MELLETGELRRHSDKKVLSWVSKWVGDAELRNIFLAVVVYRLLTGRKYCFPNHPLLSLKPACTCCLPAFFPRQGS